MINSVRHSWIQHAAKLARNREYRRTKERLLIGGHCIVQEYIQSKLPIIKLAVSPTYLRRHAISSPFIEVEDECIKYVTREPSPEGIIAEIPFPVKTSTNPEKLVVLVGLRLPGNIGTLIRSAKAFGWGIMMVDPCADPFSYEAIRCSKGMVLYSVIETCSMENLVERLGERLGDFQIVLATSAMGNEMSSEIATGIKSNGRLGSKPIALLLGNESVGLSLLPESIKASSISASIKMESNVESLNVAVAGSIMMHALFQPATREEGR